MAFTQQEATEAGLPLALCNEWEAWMQEFWTQAIGIYGSRKLHLENVDNEIRFLKHYTLKATFVNSSYLEAEVWYKDIQVAMVRLVGKKEDLVAFTYGIANNHFQNVVLRERQ